MITIIQNRGTGKAKKLLETARKNNAIIITQDKRAFEVKARSYGFSDVEILDYEDLEDDNYTIDKPVLIHEVNHILPYLLDRYYGLKVIGYSGTYEEEK